MYVRHVTRSFVALALAVIGCGSPAPSQPPVVFDRPTPAAPAQLLSERSARPTLDRDAACVIEGVISELLLHSDEALATPLVHAGPELRVRIGHLHPESDVVRVLIAGQRQLRVEGWARVRVDRNLYARERLMAAPVPFAIPQGGSFPLEAITAMKGGRLHLELETSFIEPAKVRFDVPCAAFSFGAPTVATIEKNRWVHVEASGPTLSFHGAPGKARWFEAKLHAERTLEELERRDGFVRVLFRSGPIELDSWVPDAQVSHAGVGTSVGNLCRSHRASPPWPSELGEPLRIVEALYDAPLWIGASTGGEPAGSVEKGAMLVVIEERDDRVAFELVSGAISAPEGRRFFTEKAALRDVARAPEFSARHRQLVSAERAALEELAASTRAGCRAPKP